LKITNISGSYSFPGFTKNLISCFVVLSDTKYVETAQTFVATSAIYSYQENIRAEILHGFTVQYRIIFNL